MKKLEIGLVIVGDEILSGKRQDKHLVKVIELLGSRGLSLAWARYAPDQRDQLIALYRQTFAGDQVVFSCGGIGSTPDDHTRQAAAAALEVPLAIHPEARALITQRCVDMAAHGRGSADMSAAENQQRLQMGSFPAGSQIIPNPFNGIPGFAIHRHWFLPGFPVMAWPMIASILDTQYGLFFNRNAGAERSLIVFETAESALVPIMEEVESRYPGMRTFSLPSVGDGSDGLLARRHVELGVKGPPEEVEGAFALLQSGLQRLGAEVAMGVVGVRD